MLKYNYLNDPRLKRNSFFLPFNVPGEKRAVAAHTYLRGASIPASVLNKRVAVYNGIKFLSFRVQLWMVGRKFGEFALTKSIGGKIHARIKAKKKKSK